MSFDPFVCLHYEFLLQEIHRNVSLCTHILVSNILKFHKIIQKLLVMTTRDHHGTELCIP